MALRRAFLLILIVTAVGSATVTAQRGGGGAGRGNAALLAAQAARQKEVALIRGLADDAMAGRPTANDLGLTWQRDDLLKAVDNQQEYVPFTVTIDPSKTTESEVEVYWRVVNKNAPPPAPPAPPAANAKKDDKKKDDKKAAAPPEPQYAWESLTAQPVVAGQPVRIARSFTVPSGNYDVYVVVKETPKATPPSNNKNDKNSKDKDKAAAAAPAPKVSVLKQTMTVPDLWTNELATSSMLIAEKIEQLATNLTPEQRAIRPYALGNVEFVPFLRNKFQKKEELDAFLLIYNAKVDEKSNKPDVTVEFNFYTKAAGGETFFNKTNPTNLNANTLPPTFDLAAGHQLQAGQAVPLASFPDGDYRLEIKVTDNVTKKSLSRNMNFTISGS